MHFVLFQDYNLNQRCKFCHTRDSEQLEVDLDLQRSIVAQKYFLKELVSILKYCLAKFLFSKSFALCDEEEVLYYQKLRRLPRIQVLQMPPASLEQPMRLC